MKRSKEEVSKTDTLKDCTKIIVETDEKNPITITEITSDKINLIAEVDNTIISICKKVTNDEIITEDYSQVVNALAKLVSARALVDYVSKFCADSSPVREVKSV